MVNNMGIDSINDILDKLSDEEKLVLEKINQKILQAFENENNQNKEILEKVSQPASDFSEINPGIIHSKNLTKSPNELIFSIRAEASEIDSRGQLISVVDLIEKFYHIPISAGDEYKKHIDDFFDKFHSNLEDHCKIICKNIPNETNKK